MAEVVTQLTIDPAGAESGSQRYVAAMAAANAAAAANLKTIADSTAAVSQQFTAMNDNAPSASNGFRVTGEDALTLANHVRQAAEAAYAFSPAFRSVVNEMAVPVLRTAGAALEAVASGMVTATNIAGTGLIAVAGAAEKVSPGFLGATSAVRSAGIAMEAFAPTLGGVAASIGAVALRFVPLLGQILLVYDAVKLSVSAWELATQRLEQYNAISNNAIGVSTDFYQRITKGAEAAKLSTDDLTAALKSMNDTLAPKLGGSDGINRLDALTKAGNFSGNTGVAQLKGATGTQEQFAAMVKLIHDAGDASERLAGIDLAKTVFGSVVADNLSKDYGYLDKIKQKADSISGADIISDADVARAVQIQSRFDAAYKTLSERWHPLQEVLTDLGEKFKLEWLSFLEAVAAVATAFEKAYNWASRLASLVVDSAKQGARQAAGLQGTQYGPLDDNVGTTLDFKTRQLGAALAQPNQVKRGTQDLESVYSSIRGDKSNNPDDTPATTAAYDRATESLLKYIKTTEASAATIGLSAQEQEKAKAVAQLMAAAEKDGTTVTAELAAEMDKLGNRAAAAAEALAKAKIAADIKFQSNTALLSAEDVQIATQLKTIYPDVATALGSVEAAGIRTNNAMKGLSQALETNLTSGLTDILSGTKSVSQGFGDMGLAVAKAIEQMIIKIAIVQPLMQAMQASLGGPIGSLLSGGGAGALGITYGTPGTAGSNLFGPVAPPGLPGYAGGTDSAPGGWSIVGENGPELVNMSPGGRVIPNGGASGGGGGTTQVNVNVQNYGNDNVSVNQKQNSNGGVDLEVMVGQAAASQMAKKGSALRQVTDNRQLLASR